MWPATDLHRRALEENLSPSPGAPGACGTPGLTAKTLATLELPALEDLRGHWLGVPSL